MPSLKKIPAPGTSWGGLYFHIPYCIRKCPYCDFYSTTDTANKSEFLEMLIREIEMTAPFPFPVDSLYFGGGTPSLIRASEISRIMEAAHRIFDISPDSEITIEANPGTIGIEQLKEYRQVGINRINIGIQSFQHKQLLFLDRIHSNQDARLSIKVARQAGYHRLGLDLIYGIPGQSRHDWMNDLQEAVEFSPEHLSCYSLTCEPGTPLDKNLKKGRFAMPTEEELSHLFKATYKYLRDNGYERYEISNFERSDPAGHHAYRSRHNQKYWNYAPYLGFGPSAHSFLEPNRHWNIRDVDAYISRLKAWQSPIEGKETLTKDQQMMEVIYLGLRQTDGISIQRFNQKFNADFNALYGKLIAELKERGLVQADENRCSLTPSGMLLCDTIAGQWVSYGMKTG